MECVQKKILLGHKSGIYALDLLPDGKFLSGAGDGWIVEWPAHYSPEEDGTLISKVDAQIFDLCYHEATQTIWAGDMNGGVYVIDHNQKALLHKQAHHAKGTYLMESRNDFVLSAGADGRFTIWSTESYLPEQSFTISKQHLRAASFHPSRPVMAIAGGDGYIYIFHTESWKCIQQIEYAHDRSIFDLLFHPNGEILYSGGMDAQLKAWDWATAVALKEVPAHRFTINGMIIDQNRGTLVTASRDNSLKIWSLRDLQLIKVVDHTKASYHMNSVNVLRYDQNFDALISGSDDRTIRTWAIQ
jgi:WD40 repeat protein